MGYFQAEAGEMYLISARTLLVLAIISMCMDSSEEDIDYGLGLTLSELGDVL